MMKAFMCLFINFTLIFLCFISQSYAQPVILEQAIQEALSKNPDLLQLRQEMQSVNALFWKTVLPENPGFFAEYEAVPENRFLSDYGGRKIGFAQEFAFPLAYYYRVQWHSHEKKDVTARYFQTRNEIVAGVKKSFFKVLLLRNKLALYEDIESLTLQLFQKAKARFAAGETSSYDTLKVKVDLVDVENQVLTITRDYNVALYELKLLLGRRKSEPIEIEGELSFSPISLDLDSLKLIAMAEHPLLREALAHVGKKKVEKKLTLMELVPQLEIRYFNHSIPDNLYPNAWGGAIGFSIPIWAFMKERGSLRSAIYQVDAAGWQLESEKRKVLLAVDDAFSRLVITEKQVRKYQESTLAEVDELVRIAVRSYEEGEMGYLEVTEALRTLNRTNVGYSEALFEHLAAKVDLENAVGIPTFGDNWEYFSYEE